MEDLSFNGEPVTHGHKVAIGTLIATAFTEIFFADPKGPPAVPKNYRPPGKDEQKAEVFEAVKNSKGRDLIADTSMAKLMDEKKTETVNQAFRDSWKEIRDQVLEKLLPYEKLRELFSRAQCPLQSEAIGLKRSDAIATLHRAQMIRNKYCVFFFFLYMGNFVDILQKIDDSYLYFR
jgi:glycerol dehydrogenase-like iron-containing ADH family enzyme